MAALFRNAVIQRAFLRYAARQRFMNIYIANVPGPPVSLYLTVVSRSLMVVDRAAGWLVADVAIGLRAAELDEAPVGRGVFSRFLAHHRSFVVVQSAIAVADRVPVALAGAAAAAEASDDLLKLFGSVSDGRSGQGRDHPVAAVLALAAAAVVAGMKGYTAIAGWVKDVPAPVLADLYMRAGARPAAPPSKATIWRVITDADAEVFDASTGSWLMSSLLGEPAGLGEAAGTGRDDPGLMPVRLDGKTVRGAPDA